MRGTEDNTCFRLDRMEKNMLKPSYAELHLKIEQLEKEVKRLISANEGWHRRVKELKSQVAALVECLPE